MNIYDSKEKKTPSAADISVAYVVCIIGCLALAEFLYVFLTGIDESAGLVWWAATIVMWMAIVGAGVLLIAAILHGLGYGGKRETFKDIF